MNHYGKIVVSMMKSLTRCANISRETISYLENIMKTHRNNENQNRTYYTYNNYLLKTSFFLFSHIIIPFHKRVPPQLPNLSIDL